MSDIFREVDEDFRHERYLKLWQQYGVYVVAAVIAIIVVVGAYALWDASVRRQRAEASDKYRAAAELVEAEKLEEAESAFESLSMETGGGYRVLALFGQAGTLAESGSREQAVEIYDQIASDGSAGQELRDLARVKAALAILDLSDLAVIQARVGDLVESGSPWRFSAREVIALAAFSDGKLEKARTEFQFLAFDPLTPVNLQSRAQEMLIILGPPADAIVNEPILSNEPDISADTAESSLEINNEPEPAGRGSNE